MKGRRFPRSTQEAGPSRRRSSGPPFLRAQRAGLATRWRTDRSGDPRGGSDVDVMPDNDREGQSSPSMFLRVAALAASASPATMASTRSRWQRLRRRSIRGSRAATSVITSRAELQSVSMNESNTIDNTLLCAAFTTARCSSMSASTNSVGVEAFSRASSAACNRSTSAEVRRMAARRPASTSRSLRTS